MRYFLTASLISLAALAVLVPNRAMSQSVVEKFRDLNVLDEKGQPVPVVSLWKNETVVLIFLRHFG